MKNYIADPSNPKIMFIGGHMTPALAVIDEMNKAGYSNIVWVGHKHSQTGDTNLSAEYKTIVSRGIYFENLSSGKLFRVWNHKTLLPAIKSLARIPLGIISAFQIIHSQKPRLIMSFGGYLAVPIAIAGWFYRIPIATHEQTITAGLANRIVAIFAKKIFTSWKENENYFPKNKIIFTGNPIRNGVFEVRSQNINFYNSLPILYVTGGNQGAAKLNELISKLLPILLNEFNIIHQTGSSTLTHDYEKAVAQRANLSDELAEKYLIKEYFSENEIGEILKKSNIIISRAGLNTCSELLALNKTCILIPISKTSQNEQYRNAKLLQNLGLGFCLKEENATPEELNRLIYKLYDLRAKGKNSQDEQWNQTVVQTRMYVKKDAAARICDEAILLINDDVE